MWSCAAHDYAFIDHTTMSRTRPATQVTTRLCGINITIF
ncbi:hypothetical protein F383_33542 [Gossypium arboreum]|uniref:Uncharacterized protein n=1 Tax=Gossypium arboreum TaxID=29729 RepID=A0A0B0N0I3_GOSAR|nr:hypothetical protein F383_33542 [Gossypium arboreum]